MKTSLNTLLKSQSGFSLTEIMVGGAILAGVGLAGTMMFKDQRVAQKQIDDDQKLVSFHQALIKTMTSTANCNATFNNRYGSSIPQGQVEIFGCSGSACSDPKTDAGSVTRTAQPMYTYNTSGNYWTDNQRVWQINNIEVAQTVSRSGPVRLKVTYRKNPELPNPKTISKDINLNVRFNNSGGFKECTNNQESSLNNLQNDICKSLNYGQADSDGMVAKWNEDSQSCEMQTSVKSCGPGLVIEGIRADGSVHCKPATQFFNNDGSKDSNTVGPCPGQTKMIWSGGKMVIQCI